MRGVVPTFKDMNAQFRSIMETRLVIMESGGRVGMRL